MKRKPLSPEHKEKIRLASIKRESHKRLDAKLAEAQKNAAEQSNRPPEGSTTTDALDLVLSEATSQAATNPGTAAAPAPLSPLLVKFKQYLIAGVSVDDAIIALHVPPSVVQDAIKEAGTTLDVLVRDAAAEARVQEQLASRQRVLQGKERETNSQWSSEKEVIYQRAVTIRNMTDDQLRAEQLRIQTLLAKPRSIFGHQLPSTVRILNDQGLAIKAVDESEAAAGLEKTEGEALSPPSPNASSGTEPVTLAIQADQTLSL